MTPSVRKDVILVVDDSPDSLGMIHHALDQAGLTALVALEGEQALGIAEKMVPDLVLMDAVMPNMDGFETCRRLKRHPELAAVPVIFMTGLTDAEDVVRGLAAGGVDDVTKPVRPDELIARIRVHLHNARMTQGAHTALDRLGQASFSTDRQGHWRWATPGRNTCSRRPAASATSASPNWRHTSAAGWRAARNPATSPPWTATTASCACATWATPAPGSRCSGCCSATARRKANCCASSYGSPGGNPRCCCGSPRARPTGRSARSCR